MKNQVKTWEKDYKANADSILSMSRIVSRLENLLMNRCKGYSDGTDFMDVDYNAVKKALEQNEMLIDFTDYISQSQGRKYAAYIMNKVQDYPLLKALFAERQIDSLSIVRPDMIYDKDYAQDVLQLRTIENEYTSRYNHILCAIAVAIPNIIGVIAFGRWFVVG